MVSIFIILVQLTQKKTRRRKELWSQFECGFNIINPSHIPFSIQFFVVALLFLIFDVEIALILSYPLEVTSTKRALLISSFILILTIGLLYEWQKSKIEWSEWMWTKILCKNQKLTLPHPINVAYKI